MPRSIEKVSVFLPGIKLLFFILTIWVILQLKRDEKMESKKEMDNRYLLNKINLYKAEFALFDFRVII